MYICTFNVIKITELQHKISQKIIKVTDLQHKISQKSYKRLQVDSKRMLLRNEYSIT